MNDVGSFGRRRAEDFLAAMPPDLARREDHLPAEVRLSNLSKRAKIMRIYVVADQLSEIRKPHVACKKGCSHCCHMTVRLTSTEAQRLGEVIGRAPARLTPEARARPADAFAGVACPFLVDDVCSIYENRPLSCRTHASFDENNSNCHPDVMNTVQVQLIRFSGLDSALMEVSADRGEITIGDIRDFFPVEVNIGGRGA